MEAAIVLYPSPPIGHLVAMVELGQLILTRHPSLSIHILITTPPYRADDTAKYIASVSTTNPSIIFHHLSTVSLPPSLTSSSNHESLTLEILRLNNPNVRQALLSISTNFSVRAFVLDFFCAIGLSVAADLNIPATSSSPLALPASPPSSTSPLFTPPPTRASKISTPLSASQECRRCLPLIWQSQFLIATTWRINVS
ncbi:UDP-glycosyltransferase 88A1 [Prunus yedoensis var. nudiflora]|uniref:UDP-glycosyltransferase 88A1 n=1 Tax=Prunus yedoensis var. nudiflora TaxID=2094558 RepID=A0A314UUM2_PRUYE|nr:UDP-glycosyltransferase 88A1 [Prunus yedoensis var. nudiflora]